MDDYVGCLVERDDIAYEETVEAVDAEEFERTRARAAEIDGGIAVAVRNDDGEVLLVENDWMDGYGFPGGGVEPGEDWERAAAREVEEETGVAVEIERPWLVVRGVVEHDGERLDGHAVFYLATPVGDETVDDIPGVEDEIIEDVGWFGQVPDESIQPDLVRDVLDDAV